MSRRGVSDAPRINRSIFGALNADRTAGTERSRESGSGRRYRPTTSSSGKCRGKPKKKSRIRRYIKERLGKGKRAGDEGGKL